jgi:putative ABC transport system ATP-binding protein
MSTTYAVEVRGVVKTFAEGAASVRALDGIDLRAAAGEVLVLMGPSGSGKTTLLSIMGCILRPTAGSVRIRGREVSHLSEAELPDVRLAHIGFVFQGFNLFPTLNAQENVELALDLKGIRGKEARKRAAAILDRVGLSDRLRAFPANLSGGQKQRVAIARALAGAPDILLADEPTAALDIGSGRNVVELLKSLAHDDGRTVVLVTHDNRILDVADRIVHMEEGRIREAALEPFDPLKPMEPLKRLENVPCT